MRTLVAVASFNFFKGYVLIEKKSPPIRRPTGSSTGMNTVNYLAAAAASAFPASGRGASSPAGCGSAFSVSVIGDRGPVLKV
jgi:hypothetical protein